MYKVSVPVMNANVIRNDRERLLKELKRFDAKRVFLAIETYEIDYDKRKKAMEELKQNCDFFKAHGFEVGAWLWTFWVKDNKEFTNMRSIEGTEIKEFMCPSDDRFVDFSVDYIKDVARCGVDMIMFDDDFRYGLLSDASACLCDNHIAQINSMTNSHLTREEIRDYIVKVKKIYTVMLISKQTEMRSGISHPE